mmetsp:Transcript_77669/g.225387  ORF Transcript_77669/g.225387 Transcript_77669/m.225387 type:complete len:128 (-) Transcript_77669:34-417(-)
MHFKLRVSVLASTKTDFIIGTSIEVVKNHLVRSSLGDKTEVCNIDGLLQSPLIRGVKNSIERDVLQQLVNAEFVGIENHFPLLRLRRGCDYCPERDTNDRKRNAQGMKWFRRGKVLDWKGMPLPCWS